MRIRDTDRDLELRHLVCCVYVRALETLPALVRQWWTALDKRSSDLVCTFDDDDNAAAPTTTTATTTTTTLTTKTSELNDRDFIIRNIYKDLY